MKKILLYFIPVLLINAVNAQVFIGFNYTTPQSPLAFAGNDTTVKANATFTLSGSFSGGTAPFNHYWSPGVYLNDSTLLNPTAVLTQGVTFTFHISDANVCLASDQVVITVTPDGIEDVELSNIKIYPNPNTGDFIICGLPQKQNGSFTLNIRNILGEIIYTKRNITGSEDLIISLGKIPAGIYLLELSDNNSKILRNISIR